VICDDNSASGVVLSKGQQTFEIVPSNPQIELQRSIKADSATF